LNLRPSGYEAPDEGLQAFARPAPRAVSSTCVSSTRSGCLRSRWPPSPAAGALRTGGTL